MYCKVVEVDLVGVDLPIVTMKWLKILHLLQGDSRAMPNTVVMDEMVTMNITQVQRVTAELNLGIATIDHFQLQSKLMFTCNLHDQQLVLRRGVKIHDSINHLILELGVSPELGGNVQEPL